MKICKIKIITSPQNKPPFFMGIVLRSAFGRALKSVSCINYTYKCEGCFAFANCLYFKLYEHKNEYKKFRFDFLLGQDRYDFGIYLFNEVCNELPYIVSALEIMLNKMKFRSFKIFINGADCKKDGTINLPEKFTFEPKFDIFSKSVIIKFLTPLRIKKDGGFTNGIDINDILNSLLKRKANLFGIDEKISKILTSKVEIKFKYLGGKNNTMRLGGYLGQISVDDVSHENFRLLKLGEILGVGKQCVYGLGKIKVEYKDE